MKACYNHPLPIKPGNYREALIKLSRQETEGLFMLLEETLLVAPKDVNILINFENCRIVDEPTISCVYEEIK